MIGMLAGNHAGFPAPLCCPPVFGWAVASGSVECVYRSCARVSVCFETAKEISSLLFFCAIPV